MALDLVGYERKARAAVRTFWATRASARRTQEESGAVDQGERSGVTAGKNMDGFVRLVREVVHANGPAKAEIHVKRSLVTLPGFFRPTKLWDVLVMDRGRLVAALEFKSQVGPSFGNNFNNRAEEAIGSAHDLWTAFRDGAFGDQSRPFVGWLILVEDANESRTPVRHTSPHFPTFPEFDNASYVDRYGILCRKLVRERLYTSAAVLVSPRRAIASGVYSEVDESTGLHTFLATLAGHAASAAERS